VAPDGTQTMIGSGFQFPAGVAADGAGNVYVSDPFIVAVFKITPSGAQTTVGGGYNTPVGVAVDTAGNVYVADSFNATVFKVTPNGTQTMLGNNLTSPAAVAVDAADDVYISDGGTNAVYEVTPAGVQTTVAGGFDVLDGIAADSSGNLFIADSFRSKAIKIDRADAPSLTFDKTEPGATSKDSPQTVEIDNIGNAPLAFSSLSFPTDFPMAHSAAGQACTSSTSLAASNSCALAISFTPIAELKGSKSVVLSEEVKFKTDVLNKPNTQATISVSGAETTR
jgi:large repetitive protein